MTFDLGVIGAGPGGYVAAIRASQLGLKVAVIEKEPTLGGTCLNVGCIPSKALLYSSEHFYKWKEEGASLGIITNNLSYDLDVMMRRKEKVVKGFVDGIAFLFRKNKIQRFQGVGKLISPNKVSVNGEVIECKNILLATGSDPIALPFLPFDEETIVTSTGALSLKKVPKKMVVVGAGVVGLELGSVYSRLGAEVTFIELMEKVCPTFDETISDRLLKIFTKQKMAFHLNSKVVGGKKEGGGVILKIESKDKNTFDIAADVVLVAIGRRPYMANLGVEEVGILKENGRIKVDGNFRTNISSIFAIGDLVDGPMLAHKASEEGFSVSDFISGKITAVNYLAIPSVMYTSPEVAFVGLTEKEARAAGFEVNIGNFPFTANSRANTSEGADGLVKIIGDAKTDVCLGLHIICPAASEIIGEGVMIMRKKMTLKEIGESSHAHPTYSEAIKEAALMAKGQVIHM